MKNSETEADRHSHGKKHGMVVLNQEITFYHKTFCLLSNFNKKSVS